MRWMVVPVAVLFLTPFAHSAAPEVAWHQAGVADFSFGPFDFGSSYVDIYFLAGPTAQYAIVLSDDMIYDGGSLLTEERIFEVHGDATHGWTGTTLLTGASSLDIGPLVGSRSLDACFVLTVLGCSAELRGFVQDAALTDAPF